MGTRQYTTEQLKDKYDLFQLCKYKSNNVKAHFHRNPELYCVYEGKVRANIDDEIFELEAGDAVFVSNSKIHSYECDNAEIAFALIGTKYLQPFYEIYLDRQIPVLLKNKEANKILFDYIDSVLGSNVDFKALERYACVCNILGIIVDAYGTVPAPEKKAHRADLSEVIKYIYNNSSQELSLKFLARRFNYDPVTLSRLFGRYIKMDLRNFINNIRIQNFTELKNMPQNANKSVTELAMQCGFSSIATFYRAYKKFSEDVSGKE